MLSSFKEVVPIAKIIVTWNADGSVESQFSGPDRVALCGLLEAAKADLAANVDPQDELTLVIHLGLLEAAKLNLEKRARKRADQMNSMTPHVREAMQAMELLGPPI